MSKREKILGLLTVLVVLGAGLLTVVSPPPGAEPPEPPASALEQVAASAQLPPGFGATARLQAPAAATTPPAPRAKPAAPSAVDLKLLREYLLEPPSRELAVAESDIPDPFKPVIPSGADLAATTSTAATKAATGPAAWLPILEGVYIAGADRMAVVDGKTVQAGDRLRDLVVGEVRSDGLVCRKGSRKFLLTFTGLTPLW